MPWRSRNRRPFPLAKRAVSTPLGRYTTRSWLSSPRGLVEFRLPNADHRVSIVRTGGIEQRPEGFAPFSAPRWVSSSPPSSAAGTSNTPPCSDTTNGFLRRRAAVRTSPQALERVGVKQSDVRQAQQRGEEGKKTGCRPCGPRLHDPLHWAEIRVAVGESRTGTPPMVSPALSRAPSRSGSPGLRRRLCYWREISRITVSVPPQSSATNRRERGQWWNRRRSWAFRAGIAGLRGRDIAFARKTRRRLHQSVNVRNGGDVFRNGGLVGEACVTVGIGGVVSVHGPDRTLPM